MKATYFALTLSTALLAPASTADAQRASPCTLLTLPEVQQAFPDAKAGQLDRALEKDGILRCRWNSSNGWLMIIGGADGPDSTKDEAETWAYGLVDPVRGDVSKSVRFESLAGVGDEAIAVVERRNQAKGVLQDGAWVVVRRGKRQVSVLAPELARSRERADALRMLSELGKAVAKRLG